MTDLSPNRRTIVRTAAWAVPAVSVAAAAPSLAASTNGPPNLSTSISGGGERSGNQLTIQPSTFINTGGTDAEGLTVVFNSTDVDINQISILGSNANGFLGISVTGTPGRAVTMVLPPGTSLGQVFIEANGGEYKAPVPQVLTFGGPEATTLTVTATATNGGIPFTTTQDVPAA